MTQMFVNTIAANGFIINGLPGSELGGSIASAGDVNGDGKADIIIGAKRANNDAGEAYVIYGGSITSPIMVPPLASQGFVINSVSVNDWLGVSVAGLGDVNGDGTDDIVVGAPYANRRGAAYVIYGSSIASPITVTMLTASQGFVINGAQIDSYLGVSVAGAGDINDDGISDIIVGAYGANNGAGAAYVIYGGGDKKSPIEVSTLTASQGFAINGAPGSWLGNSVAGLKDINGDGKNDIVIGAPNINNGAGAAYIVYGGRNPASPIEVSTLTGTQGFVINGAPGSWLGISIASAGDVNGDGNSDVIVGAPNANNNAGAAYIVYGGRNPVSPIEVSTLTGSQGFVINGELNDKLGSSVASAGDFNCDRKDDLIVGAYGANSGAGAVYSIYGGSSITSPITPSTLTTSQGFIINGAPGSWLGYSLARVKDLNGDGKNDIILGALSANNGAGVAYVIYGDFLKPSCDRLVEMNLIDLSVVDLLNSDLGFKISGSQAVFGSSIIGVSDVNGDGMEDLCIGSGDVESLAYIIYGKKNITDFMINGANDLDYHVWSGFIMTGQATSEIGYSFPSSTRYADHLGGSVSNIGDINRDGINDFAVTAPLAQVGSVVWGGRCYVVYGRNDSISQNLDLAHGFPNSYGFKIEGYTSWKAIGMLKSIGDFNGDGREDYAIHHVHSASGYNNNDGAVFVIWGSNSYTDISLSQNLFSLGKGFKIFGVAGKFGTDRGYNFGGGGIAFAYINNDLYSDILVGSETYGGSDSHSTRTPATLYVIYGKSNIAGDYYDIGPNYDLVGQNIGIKIYSSDVLEYVLLPHNIGDINGDTYDDIAITSNLNNIYVLYGRNQHFRSDVNLTDFSSYAGIGFKITATNNDIRSLISFDFDQDGKKDIAVGTFKASLGERSECGAVHIIYGKNNALSHDITLTTTESDSWTLILGEKSKSHLGMSLAVVDLNGDSVKDLAIGAYGEGAVAGNVYVIDGLKFQPLVTDQTSTPSDTKTLSVTATPTPTPSYTKTPSATPTPTPSYTKTSSATPTPSFTPTITETSTSTSCILGDISGAKMGSLSGASYEMCHIIPDQMLRVVSQMHATYVDLSIQDLDKRCVKALLYLGTYFKIDSTITYSECMMNVHPSVMQNLDDIVDQDCLIGTSIASELCSTLA